MNKNKVEVKARSQSISEKTNDESIDLLWNFAAHQMPSLDYLHLNIRDILHLCFRLLRIANQIIPFAKHKEHRHLQALSLHCL